MKARVLVFLAILAMVTVSVAVAGEAQKPILWKTQSVFPLNMPLTDNALALWAKKVQDMAGGRLKIELHGEGEIVKGPELYNAVRDGILDAGQNTPAWQKGRFPAGDLF